MKIIKKTGQTTYSEHPLHNVMDYFTGGKHKKQTENNKKQLNTIIDFLQTSSLMENSGITINLVEKTDLFPAFSSELNEVFAPVNSSKELDRYIAQKKLEDKSYEFTILQSIGAALQYKTIDGLSSMRGYEVAFEKSADLTSLFNFSHTPAEKEKMYNSIGIPPEKHLSEELKFLIKRAKGFNLIHDDFVNMTQKAYAECFAAFSLYKKDGDISIFDKISHSRELSPHKTSSLEFFKLELEKSDFKKEPKSFKELEELIQKVVIKGVVSAIAYKLENDDEYYSNAAARISNTFRNETVSSFMEKIVKSTEPYAVFNKNEREDIIMQSADRIIEKKSNDISQALSNIDKMRENAYSSIKNNPH